MIRIVPPSPQNRRAKIHNRKPKFKINIMPKARVPSSGLYKIELCAFLDHQRTISVLGCELGKRGQTCRGQNATHRWRGACSMASPFTSSKKHMQLFLSLILVSYHFLACHLFSRWLSLVVDWCRDQSDGRLNLWGDLDLRLLPRGLPVTDCAVHVVLVTLVVL